MATKKTKKKEEIIETPVVEITPVVEEPKKSWFEKTVEAMQNGNYTNGKK
jgi:hypothetical protein